MGRGARLLAVCLLGLACATGSRPRAEAPPRVKDSAPDKIAAQRAASGNLRLEEDDDRWGIEAARERKNTSDQRKPPSSPSAPSPTGAVQVQP